jgi:hypothetical protein
MFFNPLNFGTVMTDAKGSFAAALRRFTVSTANTAPKK